MAYLKPAKSEEEIKMMTPAKVKAAYSEISSEYAKLVNKEIIYCHKCDGFMSTAKFYTDTNYASTYFPICKACIRLMVEQRKSKRETPNETKQSVQKVLQMMNLPYIDDLYESCKKNVEDDVAERNRTSPFSLYIVQIKSLPAWRGRTWADSVFGNGVVLPEEEENKVNEALVKKGRKRFGHGYSVTDYMFLEKEYEEWTQRYACETKAQEILFERICFKRLNIDKAQKMGKTDKEISELDKSLQELMGSLNIRPSQSNSNALTEAKTFGQLIEKWEREQPIPEPDDDFKDVDKIGLYIDVFFKGHLSKMMGLKNAFSRIYENYIKKYTVSKPQYEEDVDSEVLFEQIFGSKTEE